MCRWLAPPAPCEPILLWQVTSHGLLRIKPRHPLTQDERVVESARQGIGRGVRYTQRFTRNSAGRVVPVSFSWLRPHSAPSSVFGMFSEPVRACLQDRAFNTVRLVEAMSGPGAVELSDWDVEEPNVLRLTLKGGRGTRPLKSLTVR